MQGQTDNKHSKVSNEGGNSEKKMDGFEAVSEEDAEEKTPLAYTKRLS